MDFVELNRSFAPIEKDKELNPDIARFWGHKLSGWLNWAQLLEYRRVVLLAEAASGKTWEFQNRAQALREQGQAAFFVTIEDLADDSFVAALDPALEQAFVLWRDGDVGEDGWFFLDSVDEARLHHKSLGKALRRFAWGIGAGIGRARIYISCRVSDWKGQEDRKAVKRILSVPEALPTPEPVDRDAALLDPIFEEREESSRSSEDEEADSKHRDILVVQLVPLSTEQQRRLMAASQVTRPDEATTQIERSGLSALADRPGDLLELAGYWKEHGQFGSLVDMVEHGITAKLSERDGWRPDNSDLTSEQARHGAERLAAALTLGKSSTIRAPGHDPDTGLSVGAVEPEAVLPEWNAAERNALLRRGIFAPSTYGRVRFHHRGTQEYLTAQWLHRLLKSDCPREAVWQLLFAERYGVKTLVPSLHPVAAWLAIQHSAIRKEVLEREPLVLLRHGDPRSLPLAVKERLLLTYAQRDVNGEISNGSWDRQALALFAVPELGNAIRKGWHMNSRPDFRHDLLRLIREGTISACADLARGVVLDEGASEALRAVAIEAMAACGDSGGLAEAAKCLLSDPSRATSNLAAGFAKALFPRWLSVKDLLTVIAEVPSPRPQTYEGFICVLGDIWRACRRTDMRDCLLAGLADLALSPPFIRPHQRVSVRHVELAGTMAPIVREALMDLGDAEPSVGLVRALMAVERAEDHPLSEPPDPDLSALVTANTRVQRKLFWADVEEMRLNAGDATDQPTYHWQAQVYPRTLWRFTDADLDWLTDDLVGRPLPGDRRIALSAILDLLAASGKLESGAANLRSLVASSSGLVDQLAARLAPPVGNQAEREKRDEILAQRQDYAERAESRKRENEASWLRSRDEIEAAPSVLCDPVRLAERGASLASLCELTGWLQRRTRNDYEGAATQWRLLAEGFGDDVAQAYRDGLKILWRITPPERPGRKGNTANGMWTAILLMGGLGIEAAESPDWASRLTPAQAVRAAQHACLSEDGYPGWFDALAESHPAEVLPILRKALRREMSARRTKHYGLLSRFSCRPVPSSLQQLLCEVITGQKPGNGKICEHVVGILARLDLDDYERERIARLACRRFHASLQAVGGVSTVRHHMAMLFLTDPDQATRELADWFEGIPKAEREAEAATTLAMLFQRNSPVAQALRMASVASLDTLARLAYRHVRREDDDVHSGPYSPGPRDRAEEARGHILSALLARPGPEAYHAVLRLAGEDTCPMYSLRFREMARGKAEADAETPAWTPEEVRSFERSYVVPAKTGEALLDSVMGVLSDIRTSSVREDSSSLPLLLRAADEDEVQKWLAEQLRLRSKGRFQVHREAQIARGDKPDIITASTAAQLQVAIEVKHGGMHWSVRDYEKALTGQLAKQYLKPENRRWGVLVISHHGKRFWVDPETKRRLEFQDVIRRLQALAERISLAPSSSVTVRVCGIDASSAT